MLDILRTLWFRDPNEATPYINDVAVRIRAGFLLAIPLYMGLTLFDVVYGSSWVITGTNIMDTGDTDWDGRIIYQVEALRRVYEYPMQTAVLWYALFEMLAGMFVFTSRFSPTILISSFLARHRTPEWKPLTPKRFAWSLGATFIVFCLVFFNPDTFANWVNGALGSELLPTTYNYLPLWVPIYLVWICLGFMWLEAILGFCVGCKIHALLVKMGILKEECEACNNLDWDAIARRAQEKKAAQEASAGDKPPAA